MSSSLRFDLTLERILIMPFLSQQLSEIHNTLKCCIKKKAPVFKFKMDFQSKTQLSMLNAFETEVFKALLYNLVYRFKCNLCDGIYHGKIIHHFKARACGHLRITTLTWKR